MSNLICSKPGFSSASHHSSPSSISAIELIQQFHPNTFRLSVSSIATLLDCAEQSIRNGICSDTFPIKSSKEGGKRYFDVRDVAAFLDAQRSIANAEKKHRRGRPTKAECLARASALKGGDHA